MAKVIFFTKPGCATSQKQIELLTSSGHEVEIHNLLSHNWSKEELEEYFKDMPVNLWFNPNSPRVNSGEIAPDMYNTQSAFDLMLADPLLIRRPLMKLGNQHLCGFDPKTINDLIGLTAEGLETGNKEDYASCSQPSGNLQQCP